MSQYATLFDLQMAEEQQIVKTDLDSSLACVADLNGKSCEELEAVVTSEDYAGLIPNSCKSVYHH
jgi:hypothetical protein